MALREIPKQKRQAHIPIKLPVVDVDMKGAWVCKR